MATKAKKAKRRLKNKRISPQEWRAKFSQVRDQNFTDAISVAEAVEIIGISDSWVRKLIQRGIIAGKVMTRTGYIVSLKDARENAERYRLEAKGKGRSGRPRSKA